MLDILIIGGGPIGIACGLKAQKAGLSFLIVEKGCLTNSIYNYPVTTTFFSTSERLEIDNIPFTTLHAKPNRAEALEYYRRITLANALPVKLFEEVIEVTRLEAGYAVTTTKAKYEVKNVIIATGFYDVCVNLDIPGEDLPKVKHYFTDPHYYAMQKVVVVGASNSAIDVALETFRKGAEVTLVVRGPEIGPRVKYWVRPDVINRIEEGTIKAYFNSALREIRDDEVDIETPEGPVTIKNDFVLAMTGYQPNFSQLKKWGLKMDNDLLVPTYNPDTMETHLPGLYLAGVVCGGLNTHIWFIENSRVHAEMIMNDIVSKR
jgi:thioredoxin reductase (NADPH)